MLTKVNDLNFKQTKANTFMLMEDFHLYLRFKLRMNFTCDLVYVRRSKYKTNVLQTRKFEQI